MLPTSALAPVYQCTWSDVQNRVDAVCGPLLYRVCWYAGEGVMGSAKGVMQAETVVRFAGVGV